MQDEQVQAPPFPGSPVIPETFGDDKVIQFRCRPGITCWNACCSNIDISLTPYDILRLKQRFEIDSSEFLKQHTVPYELEPNGIAGVKLRPVAGGTACPFMKPEGCGVYEDRPTACRYYPVALLSMRRQDEYTDRSSFALVQEPHCQGHAEPRSISITDYREEQGLGPYDDAARGWRQLILKKKSSGPSIGKPSKRSLELFFMVCYDLDRFRRFVASEGFSAIHEVPAEEMKELLCDDEALLQFGFRFLRQVLFGEDSIALRAEAAEERRLFQMQREQRLRTEAAVRAVQEEELKGQGEETDEDET